MTRQTRKQTGNGTPGSFASSSTGSDASSSARYVDDKPAWKTECGGCGGAHRTVNAAAKCALESLVSDGFVPNMDGDDPTTKNADSSLVAQNPGAGRLYGIRVTKRSRGRSPIRGMGSMPTGRNVDCSSCFRKQEEAFSAGESRVRGTGTVWYTNESSADVAARNAAISHTAKHLREDNAQGDDGTPGALTSRETFQADYARSTRALQAVGAIYR